MEKKYDNLSYNKKLKSLARALRKNSTPAEIRMWTELLRAGQMKGFTFLRQRPVGNYIADFMCKELKLIIEIDGESHEIENKWYKDKVRQRELEEMGLTFLRFTNDEVMTDLRNVESILEYWIEDHI